MYENNGIDGVTVTAPAENVTENERPKPPYRRLPISPKLRFHILQRDGYRCRYCGRGADIVELVVDHVLAVALGGANDPENLAASCFDCNAGKSSRPLTSPPIPPTATAGTPSPILKKARKTRPRASPAEAKQPEVVLLKDIPLTRAAQIKDGATWRGRELFDVVDAAFLWNQGESGITQFVALKRFSTRCAIDPRITGFRYSWGCCVHGWNYQRACASLAVWQMTGFVSRDVQYEFYRELGQIKEFGWARIAADESDCNPDIQYRLDKYRGRDFND